MTTTEGASPAPTPEQVEQALQACRAWTVLPDPNRTAHVLAAEVERLREEIGPLRVVEAFASAYAEVRDADPDGTAWYALALAIERVPS